MLRRFTKRFRIRATITIALLYALCVVAPHAALALVDGQHAIHCLSDAHGIAADRDYDGMTHRHADGSAHHHEDQGTPHEHSDADGKAHPANCCGIFCMNALPQAVDFGIGFTAAHSAAFAPPPVTLAGREPERLYRPPIF